MKISEITKKIEKILKDHPEIDSLPTRGPRGGNNANTDWARRAGWEHSPDGTITRAANMAGCPTLPYWSGQAPTPATALPGIVVSELEKMGVS